jgi:hypothetical protein
MVGGRGELRSGWTFAWLAMRRQRSLAGSGLAACARGRGAVLACGTYGPRSGGVLGTHGV